MHVAGGLDRGVDPFLFEPPDQGFCKVRLYHSLTSGDRDAASRFLIEVEILHTHINDFVDGLIFSLIGQRSAGAALYTGQTAGTFLKINMDPSVPNGRDCIFGTGMCTFLTVHAVLTVVHDLHPGQLGLRIGAPFAAERTSLQKYSGPHAGAVVDGKLLNIKNKTVCFQLRETPYIDVSYIQSVLIITAKLNDVKNNFRTKIIMIINEVLR